jgi:hypothetical protein
MKTIKLVTLLALFAAVALATPRVCRAGQATASPSPSPTPEEEEKKSRFSGEVGTALTNAYIFNGLVQDKDTFIAQPYLTLNLTLYEGEGFLNEAMFMLMLWSSVHDINLPAPTGSSNKAWFEQDIDPGFMFTFVKNWTFTISDYIYTSPGDYFDTSHNLSLAFEYNDSDLLKAFALHPHFYFQQELTHHAGLAFENGVAFSPDAPKGQYYEFGIGPGYTFGKQSTYPVSVTLPTAVGLGSNGFYGQGFGYFSTGLEVSVPLAFIPSTYGSWTTSVSGKYYRLGSTSSFYTNFSDPDQGVFAWTIGAEF